MSTRGVRHNDVIHHMSTRVTVVFVATNMSVAVISSLNSDENSILIAI